MCSWVAGHAVFYCVPATMGEDDKCAREAPMGDILATKRRRGEGEYRLVPLLSTLLVRGRFRKLLDPADPAEDREAPAMELASFPPS